MLIRSFAAASTIGFLMVIVLNSCTIRQPLSADWEQFPTQATLNEPINNIVKVLLEDRKHRIVAAGVTSRNANALDNSLLVYQQTANGTLLWSTRIKLPGSNDNLVSAKLDENNDIYLLATSLAKAFLVKLDSNGTLIWRHPLKIDKPRSLIVRQQDVVIAGDHLSLVQTQPKISETWLSNDSFDHIEALGDGGFIVASGEEIRRYNSKNRVQWQLTIKGHTGLASLFVDEDLDLVVLGTVVDAEKSIKLLAVSLAGEKIWSEQVPFRGIGSMISSAPLFVASQSGRLMMATANLNYRQLDAIEASSGNITWSHLVTNTRPIASMETDQFDNLYLLGSNSMQKFSADGILIARQNRPANSPYNSGASVIASDRLIIAMGQLDSDQRIKIYSAALPIHHRRSVNQPKNLDAFQTPDT